MFVPVVGFLLVFSFGAGGYDINTKKFPDDFLFGAATSSYQIEGGWNVDGKGENIWDNYTHRHPEYITDGANGDVTCDSYHKYKTDVAMLKYLGVTHYRFSLSWSRILPNGDNSVINQQGVQYYKNLIKELRDNNIEPMVTLYHWDLPQPLQDLGGFHNDFFTDWFEHYARICFEAFGDNVTYWSTFNEPPYACLGYEVEFPPGVYMTGKGQYLCGHNLIRAHAAAWYAYDTEFREKQKGFISLNIPSKWQAPASNSTEDIEASEQAMQFSIGWWANPLVFGDYPEIMKVRIANRSRTEGLNESRLPEFTEEQKLLNKGTLDYFSLNSYDSGLVKAIPEPPSSVPAYTNDVGVGQVDSNETNGAWGLPPLLKWIQSHYNDTRIIITENGLGNTEGGLDDTERQTVIRDYLSRIRDCIDDGIKIFGYTVWSLMDNFEWIYGFTKKFGMYQVDFNSTNRTRTARASAVYYKSIIAAYSLNATNLTDNVDYSYIVSE